jgi:hypothetical protein
MWFFIHFITFIIVAKIIIKLGSMLSNIFEIMIVKKGLCKILKTYSIIINSKLIEKSYRYKYLEFNILLDSNELIMGVLTNDDPRQKILKSIEPYTDKVYFENLWKIKINFIEN